MKQHISCIRRVFRLFAAALLIVTITAPARAQLVFSFSYGPGIAALFGSDPATATKITVGMSDAGIKWSGSLSDPVTLKIMVDLDPGLPPTAFAAAYVAKTPTLFPSVKVALTADSLSATDSSAVASLQPGPKIEAVT